MHRISNFSYCKTNPQIASNLLYQFYHIFRDSFMFRFFLKTDSQLCFKCFLNLSLITRTAAEYIDTAGRLMSQPACQSVNQPVRPNQEVNERSLSSIH